MRYAYTENVGRAMVLALLLNYEIEIEHGKQKKIDYSQTYINCKQTAYTPHRHRSTYR